MQKYIEALQRLVLYHMVPVAKEIKPKTKDNYQGKKKIKYGRVSYPHWFSLTSPNFRPNVLMIRKKFL